MKAPAGKTCNKCKKSLRLSDFHRDARRPSGHRDWCRACTAAADANRYQNSPEYREKSAASTRKTNLKKLYGITVEQYEGLFLEQDGKCAICGGENVRRTSVHQKLCVDHCHTTGEIRGLLCNRCNGGLGMFGDNSELLLAAIAYLNAHRGI